MMRPVVAFANIVLFAGSTAALTACPDDPPAASDAPSDAVAGDATAGDVDASDAATGDATGATDDATGADASDAPDALVIPEGAVRATGVVVPPGGASAAGWVVMNRFGATTVDATGRFALPVAEDGATLTLAHPPDRADAVLVALTARVVELAGADAPTLVIDARATARALTLIQPRVAPREAWRLGPLAALLDAAPAQGALARQLERDFATPWPAAAATRAAYADAVVDLLRRAAPPWPAAVAPDLPPDPPGVRVLRADATRALARVTVDDAGVGLAPLPGRAPAVAAHLELADARALALADLLGGAVPPAVVDAAPIDLAPGARAHLAEGVYRATLVADPAASARLAAEQAVRAWAPDPDPATCAGADLAALAACQAERADPASAALVALAADLATEPVANPLVADPDHPEAALLDPRRGPTREELVLVVGDPLGPRFDHVALDGGVLTATGREVARLVVIDARGRVRAVPADGVLPRGLEGPIVVRAATAGGIATSAPLALAPPVAAAPTLVEGPGQVGLGELARFRLTDATADLALTADGVVLPIELLAADGSVLVDTRPLPGPGRYDLLFETAAGSLATTLEVTAPHPTWTRDIAFHATDPTTRQIQLPTALELASGEAVADGEFWRRDMGILGIEDWYCPLDIRPNSAVIPTTCNHFSGVCDELWAWGDARDPGTWFTVTPPPGRKSSGAHCPPVDGPASWEGVARADLHDRVSTYDVVFLQAMTLAGPNATLTLPDARGGGLHVVAPAGPAGTRSDLVLDLDVEDAVGTTSDPVVSLDGVDGVTIAHLHIRGRSTAAPGGGCQVGLRLDHARDVRLGEVIVEGCAKGIEIRDSSAVRLGDAATPVAVMRATTGLSIDRSRDVVAHVTVGARRRPDVSADYVEIAAAGTQQDGVVVTASERVVVAGTVVATPGDAVRVEASTGVRVGPLAVGFAKHLDGSRVTEGAGVGTGLALTSALFDVVASDLEVVGATGCAAKASFGSGGATIQRAALPDGRLCVSFWSGATVADVAAKSVAIESSAEVMADGVTADALTITGTIAVAVTRSVLGRADVVGPSLDQVDPLSFGEVTLTTSDGPALTVTDARAPVFATRLRVHEVAVGANAGVTLVGGDVDRLTQAGAGHVDVTGDAHVGAADIAAGRLVVVDGDVSAVTVRDAGALEARGGSLGAVDATLPSGLVALVGGAVEGALTVTGCAAGAAVIVAGAQAGAVTIADCPGRVRLGDAAVAGALALVGVSGAEVRDVAAALVGVGDGAGVQLARVVAAGGVIREGTAREVRVVAVDGLVARDGDPDALGQVLTTAIDTAGGATLLVTAAPRDALIEVLGAARAGAAPAVVARGWTTGGQALFRGLPAEGGPWRVQATLLDGTSGPPLALERAAPTACRATAASLAVRAAVVDEPAVPCPGAPADAVTSPDCALAVRVATVDGQVDLVLIDLATGVERRLTSDRAIERDPAFEADLSGVWLARREPDVEGFGLARVDLASGALEDALARPGDALAPAPDLDGVSVAFSACPEGEDGTCHLALLDVASGAVAVAAEGGWPSVAACDERAPTWLPPAAAAVLGPGLRVQRRAAGDDGPAGVDIVSPLGVPRWRL